MDTARFAWIGGQECKYDRFTTAAGASATSVHSSFAGSPDLETIRVVHIPIRCAHRHCGLFIMGAAAHHLQRDCPLTTSTSQMCPAVLFVDAVVVVGRPPAFRAWSASRPPSAALGIGLRHVVSSLVCRVQARTAPPQCSCATPRLWSLRGVSVSLLLMQVLHR